MVREPITSAAGDDPLAPLASLDPAWLGKLRAWEGAATQGVLPAKTVALVRLILDVGITHLDACAAERHMRAALAAGATRQEILAVLKLASVVGIHAYAASAPVVREVAEAAGVTMPRSRPRAGTPAIDMVSAAGQFNPAWDNIATWDPAWLDRFLGMGAAVWTDKVLDAKTIELLCIAGDANVTHLWSSGVRRHAEAALRLGASIEEILEVIRLAATHGIESLEMAVPILDSICAET